MNSEGAWVLLSSRIQVQPQIILNRDYLPDYLSVSYDYVGIYSSVVNIIQGCIQSNVKLHHRFLTGF